MIDDCIFRKYTIRNIDWDFPVDVFPYPDLPSDVEGWSVRGYPHWSDIEWEAEAIDKVSDAYCYCIKSATIERED